MGLICELYPLKVSTHSGEDTMRLRLRTIVTHLSCLTAALSMMPGLASSADSPPPNSNPKETLGRMAGCFKVTYRFVEDGVHDARFDGWEGQDFYEWITLKETDSTLVFQHWGVTGGTSMKHWKEDWSETPDHQWTQKVFSPSGKQLRYQCTAPIRFNQWRCHAGKAEKPVIRDKDRTDYETLDRETPSRSLLPAGSRSRSTARSIRTVSPSPMKWAGMITHVWTKPTASLPRPLPATDPRRRSPR